jgi:A118 family predicted phage portal protein
VGWKKHLRELGYAIDSSMDAKIAEWHQWYTATHPWYSNTVTRNGRTFKVERLSVKPARMVCQESASLIMNERTLVSVDNEAANTWLADHLEKTRFLFFAQSAVERGHALGTAAWVPRIENLQVTETGIVVPSEKTRVHVQSFDARFVVPLSWDESGVSEAAFRSRVIVAGKHYEQLQIHRKDASGRYVIETVFFDLRGKEVGLEGFTSSLLTDATTPTFGIIRPGIENTAVDFSAYGMSVFDDALGAVKLVDESFDMIHNELYLGRKRLWLDERMMEKGSNGNVIVPWAEDQQLFRQAELDGQNSFIEEYSPELRITDARSALSTGLEMLGSRCGMGAEYFSLEGDSGVKTATEVVADDSDLFRTIRKHENALTPAVQAIIGTIMALSRQLCAAPIPTDFGAITVVYDDSVMEDTAAQKKQDLDEIASGVKQPWEYRVRWYGEDEATAKRMAPGFDLPLE